MVPSPLSDIDTRGSRGVAVASVILTAGEGGVATSASYLLVPAAAAAATGSIP